MSSNGVYSQKQRFLLFLLLYTFFFILYTLIMITLDTPVKDIPRIGEKYAKKLKKLGIESARDLLFHFPFRYDDYSLISPVSQISPSQLVTIQGKVADIKTTRTWKKRMFLTEASISDDSESIKAVWFNQPYIADTLRIGKEIRISGKITRDGNKLFFSNPAYELASRVTTNTGRLVPVYPETEGVTSRWLRWQIQTLLKTQISFIDPIPPITLKKLNLPPIQKAVCQIHFPDNLNQALVAQKRFAFEEMFLVQLKSLQIKTLWKNEKSAVIKFDEKLVKNFVNNLPFKLTDAQRKASFQILKDLEKDRPMNRLLNGDVGSGKTVVAGVASFQAIRAGYQVAIMAPTEVLARQHFNSFCKLFKKFSIKIGLVTSSYKEMNYELARLPARQGIKNKEKKKKTLDSLFIIHNSNLIIGTHALIQKDIKFKNLALIIVDEQHRFGVAQRAYLQQEIEKINDGLPGKIPHLLSMTATPIPRTLALAFFGNLDLSILDEMPKGRKEIITEIIDPLHRQKIYDFIKKEIKSGRQAFAILPLVEESKILTEVKAAVQEHKRLSDKIFPDLKLGLLHGRLKSNEKEKVMKNFNNKKVHILVATPVVEVGIDIPNATVMIIEDADRFGLSQLHQFRGRVGRGEHQSYCFLFTSSSGSTATKRLKALVESNDGFKIAERDLELRGPGEFFGTRQSGLPDIAMENLANIKLIQIAREEAQNILKVDPQLKKHSLLADALQNFSKKIHLE